MSCRYTWLKYRKLGALVQAKPTNGAAGKIDTRAGDVRP
jgi:hypothetical protein